MTAHVPRKRRASTSRTRRFAALLLVVGLTAGCGSSSFQPGPHTSVVVVLDHSNGPVRYGEPQPQIKRTLGLGLSGWRLDPGGDFFHAYPLARIYVEYSGYPPKAAVIVTRDPEYKSHGAGVGSSLRQLQNRVPVVCFAGTRYHPSSTGFHITYTSAPVTCEHGNPTTNLPVTVFKISPKTKRVTQIAIRPSG